MKDVFTDPQYAGLYWSIDPDTPASERPQAHATAALVALYLRARGAPKSGPEFLMQDPRSQTWYVRWPNGRLGWETEASFAARGLTIPMQAVLQPGLERELLAELAPDDGIGVGTR